MERSLSKGHKIETLNDVRDFYKSHGIKIKIRYRGPRRKAPSGRTSYSGQFTCLKKDAKTFAVYPRDWSWER